MKDIRKSTPVSNDFLKTARRILFAGAIILLLGMLGNGFIDVFALTISHQNTKPRTAEPVEDVIADLESFIPAYMDEQDIPGLAVALIRNNQVVWTGGYGVANSITRQPVTPDTLFEIASNSKVVTAYIALRLVDQGLLSLDEPLNSYLDEPWLPSSEYRDTITLRQVLSHSSGLGHNTLGREVQYIPGSGYSYSAIGFLYTQAVIEYITGQSLEELAREMVFAPLDMASSTFINDTGTRSQKANGHLPAILPVLLFLIPFTAGLLLMGVLVLILSRIRTGRWRPTQRYVISTTFVAFLLTSLVIILLFNEIDMLQYGVLAVLCGFGFIGSFTLAIVFTQQVLMRFLPTKPIYRRLFFMLVAAIILVCPGFLASSISNMPVPKDTTVQPSAAGTMRTTAAELATFLIELSNPQHLSPELASEMRSPQVRLGHDLSWGLGPGIQHSTMGDALWQWGQAPDYQSVMIIYPDSGSGVVVLTNSDFFNPDVAINIAHRALGGKIDPIRQASHLQYNYPGPFLDDDK